MRQPARHTTVLSRNDLFQQLEAVKRNRAKRKKLGECFVESVAAIDAALRGGWEFRALIHAAGSRLSGWASDVVAACPSATIVEIAPELLAELSDREETSELLAIVEIRRPSLEAIPLRPPFAALLLDRPSSPGNLGSVLRSADALGASGVVIRGHAADPYDRQAIRSSLGALFSVPVVSDCDNRALRAWLALLRSSLPAFQVVGTSPHARRRPWNVDFTRPTLIVLGNEKRGMSAWSRANLDSSVAIPTRGSVDSLNLAAAATVLLYETSRQRAAPRAGRPASRSRAWL